MILTDYLSKLFVANIMMYAPQALLVSCFLLRALVDINVERAAIGSRALFHRRMSSQKIDGPAVGIDLGTTYSCVCIWQNERVEIIANDQGNRTTPSWVAFTDTERLIGDAAKNQAALNPINTVRAPASTL